MLLSSRSFLASNHHFEVLENSLIFRKNPSALGSIVSSDEELIQLSMIIKVLPETIREFLPTIAVALGPAALQAIYGCERPDLPT